MSVEQATNTGSLNCENWPFLLWFCVWNIFFCVEEVQLLLKSCLIQIVVRIMPVTSLLDAQLSHAKM